MLSSPSKRAARKENAHPPTPASLAPAGGVVVGALKSGARSREAWLRSVHGEAQRIGRARSANWDLLALALARRGR